jgi:integrase
MAGLAARNDAIDRNPVRDAGRIKNGRKKASMALNEAQARQLLAFLSYDDTAIRRDLPDLVAFMLATGARLGEACALRWSDVDFDRQLVSITGTVVRLPGKGLVISSTKTTTSNRVLRLPAWIAELLHARRDNAAKDLRADVTPVFPAPLSGLRDRSNTQADLRDAFKAAGVASITSHVLRKTTATLLDSAGLSAREIADQLGHAKPSMTTDVYLGRQVASTRAADVLESLG